tara:strand:+ start:22 stop:852 length:831 start_codon:yes stop_codon:yes gene_type:complete
LTISVVIPTIGDRNLFPTLSSLNNSSVKVDEIIISAPFNNKLNINKLQKVKNVKIYISKLKGQVLQRIEGFKIAKGEIVVQLDDDIILEKDCIELLYKKIKNKKNASISPNFIEKSSNKSIFIEKKYLFKKIAGLRENGKKSEITKSGFEFYPVLNSEIDNLVETNIQLGACVMHKRENLILNNYFNFSGKAYCEDLFHSILLKKNKVKLYFLPSASVFIELNIKPSQPLLFFKELREDYKIRKLLVRENGLNYYRMILIYLLKGINYFIDRIWSL